jgi:integrase
MSHKNKVPLVDQVKQALDSKLAIGRSKHQDKLSEKQSKEITSNYIYCWETFRSYLKHGCYFVLWCKEKYRCKTLEQCRIHVDEWMDSRSALSASTQKLEASSLAKIYGCSTVEFIKTDERLRANIKRSRGKKKRDAHFSETKNLELVELCKSTGLRRAELSALKGNCLKEEDGTLYIIVRSGAKGGKYREAAVIGNVDLVVRKMSQAGNKKVWAKISNTADIHSYRGDYATAIYQANARALDCIPKSDRYYCRKDKKGFWYDKEAMKITSKALGHNRISVIAGHYLNNTSFSN